MDVGGYSNFVVQHANQLLSQDVPQIFWHTLHVKLESMQFDTGRCFFLDKIVYDENDNKKPYDPEWSLRARYRMRPIDPAHIYVIDHAWTFTAHGMKGNLRDCRSLLTRMCKLLQIPESDNTEELIHQVCKKIWRYTDSYAVIRDAPDETITAWYVKDEIGSAITHSDEPNFRSVPFVYGQNQLTLTICFPIKDVAVNDVITRNFIDYTVKTPGQRDAMLIPWKLYRDIDRPYGQVEPSEIYFLEGHLHETTPNINALPKEILYKERLKVYSEYENIQKYLTSPHFEFVDNTDEADVLWHLKHFRNYEELSQSSPNKFVNQFPFEYVITIKDLLAIIARRCNKRTVEIGPLETYPVWLPTTFDMSNELPQLASYFEARKKKGLDNHWICKPYNMARGIGIVITDNMNFLCNISTTGPKICQKYLHDPVLFNRVDVGLVKFDVRYVILLTSVHPTEMYLYKNFFLRFANKVFDLNDFDDYEKHFTVMNYSTAPLFKMLAQNFTEAWNEQYPDFTWDTIECKIFDMFKELFIAATSRPPPFGIAKSPQSRSMYAADVMICWQDINDERVMQPKLLEVNWMPDCERAGQYYPNFFNDCFERMFLNKEIDTFVKIL